MNKTQIIVLNALVTAGILKSSAIEFVERIPSSHLSQLETQARLLKRSLSTAQHHEHKNRAFVVNLTRQVNLYIRNLLSLYYNYKNLSTF